MNRELLNDVISTLEKRSVKLGKEKLGTVIYRTSPGRQFRGCVDCDGTIEGYMVQDEIWAEAFYDPKELACVCCLEKRLKRKLVMTDYTPSLVNINLFYAYRMALDFAEKQHAMDRNREQESSRPNIPYYEAVRGIKIFSMPNRGS